MAGGDFQPTTFTVQVGENWNNTGGTFTPGTSTVEFNGSGAQQIATGSGTETFYNLEIDNSSTGLSFDTNDDVVVTNELILTPGEVAEIELNRLYKTKANTNQGDGPSQDAILSWRTGTFMFQNTPLKKVFEELARHYGVALELSLPDSLEDKGLFAIFPRDITLNETLEIIGEAAALNFEKTGDRVYLIKQR